jgi:hypothetical protein
MNDILTFFGDAVKTSMDGRKVAGYLVRFGSPDASDLDGEYFTPDTDFGRPFQKNVAQPLNLYYSHGANAKIGKRKIGVGSVKMDDAGLWFEAEIDTADQYAAMVAKLAQNGKLGYSSGAAAHLVERRSVGKATEIMRWPLAEGSLTPTPAEHRNRAMSVKVMTDAMDMAADSIFDDIEQEMTSIGLQSLFSRLCYAVCYADSLDIAEAYIEEFADMALAYVTAIQQSMTAEESAEERKSLQFLSQGKAKPETLRQMERLLRDAAGFTRSEAAVIASKGFGGLDTLRDAGKQSQSETVAGLKREFAQHEFDALMLSAGV